ncbi:MAG: hypothetical protein Q9225_001849 [Loekoesia sp. 1 TL-2023]
MAEPNGVKSAQAQVFDDIRRHYSATTFNTDVAITSSLRSRYPAYTLTVTPDSTGILAFAGAEAKLDTTTDYYSASRTYKPVTNGKKQEGKMQDKVTFGKYDYAWNGYEYIVYYASFFQDYRPQKNTYILSHTKDDTIINGHSKRTDELIAAASQLFDAVWVFDQEHWSRNAELWKSVQESTWDDVIVDSTMKKTLGEDVGGFFDRKADYKELGVPWKRGIIFHGIPGNGKTISIKALMHSLSSRLDPIPTLYVKSLAGCRGPHYAIREVFVKARETAPCLLIFEDLDSLISDKVKSFFLNEVDGLESNDGIMMIGSTNYLDRLDPGIAKRPSRFDRKYHFALPAVAERTKYCDYWRSKLAKSKSIDFPPKLSAAVAEITEDFSFAYLKETFISSLLIILAAQRGGAEEINGTAEDADPEGLKHNALWRTIRKQVEALRMEMEDSRKSAKEAAQNLNKDSSKSACTD